MNSQRILECTSLAEEILKNFELSEIPIENILLKCVRLYRLLGDEEGINLFIYESSGYPSGLNGIAPKPWRYGGIACRQYKEKDSNGEEKQYMFTETLSEMTKLIEINNERMRMASDPQSYGDNMTPHMINQAKNTSERNSIVLKISKLTARYNLVRGQLYAYVLKTYQKLKYGNTVDDIFTEARQKVDDKLSHMCPEAIAKFVSVYENMDSNNPEDWANAVHSCRRILKDFADSVYPASSEPVELADGKKIKVGEDNVINRLIQFISSKADSETYNKVVGSTLQYVGERIDAIFDAVNKGTHTNISKEEAKRYIFYTYMVLSDIVILI